MQFFCWMDFLRNVMFAKILCSARELVLLWKPLCHKSLLVFMPSQPLFVNPAPPWPCPHACPPRQVHIRISSYQCGGVLLNHWYIATAAHCVHRAKLSKITVRSQIDFLQNLFCFWSRCTLVNMTRRTGKRSRWTARPTKSTTLSFILILGEGLPCKHSCKYGSSWFNRAHEWISWSSNNVKKAWKREEGPSLSPFIQWALAISLDKHHPGSYHSWQTPP